MGSWWNELGTSDEGGVAAGLGASFSAINSPTSTSDSTSSTPIGSSNIGFQLLKKHGWKEGTGLGVSEQGRLEPIEALVKKNKRGLGADREIKKKDKYNKVKDQSDDPNEKQPPKRQKKGMAKKIRQMQEFEKRMKETEMERAIFREFWADNV